MKTVVLYARASTNEQAQSIPGQLRELREHAERQGLRIVAEVTDQGEKRHTSERPGIQRLRELCEAGDVAEVWAWAWDRYGEHPIPDLLVMEFEDFGTKLRSLDDGGEGEDSDVLRTLKGVLSRKEQRSRRERSRRGRTDKTLKGEIFGGFRARYGFRFVKGPNQTGREVNVGYAVDPEKVRNVVRVFELVASGVGLKGVRREFEQAGIPNASGGPRWSTTTIRGIVQDDVYRPHTRDEIAATVPPEVAKTLDPGKLYGISWSGRKKSKFKNHRSKQRVVYEAPPEEWTAIPVDLTGSGLDRVTVDRAREAIRDNKSPAKVGDRFWELSGILKCAECGRNMIAYRRAKRGGGYNYYYRCRPSSTVDRCENRKSHPAERVEGEVSLALRRMVDDQELLGQKIADSFAAKRRELEGPTLQVGPLVEKLADLDRRREGYWTLAADGDMPKEIMRRKVEELDEQRAGLEGALDDARHRDARLAELERREKYFLSVVSGGPDAEPKWHKLNSGEHEGEHHIVLIYSAMVEGMWRTEERRKIYLGLGLRVEIDANGRIRIDGDLIPPPGTGIPHPHSVADKTLSSTLWPPAAATSSARLA